MFKSRKELVYRENLELSMMVKTLKSQLTDATILHEKLCEGQNAVINIWKERGDRYSNHNDALQDELYKLNQVLANVVSNPEKMSAYKDALAMLTKVDKK